MHKHLMFTFLLSFLFLLACQSDPNTKTDAPQTEQSPAPPVNAAATTEATDTDAPLLSQEAPVSAIAFNEGGTEVLATYRADGKDLSSEMVSADGLSSLEAHFANMIAIASGKCVSMERVKEASVNFILVNNENKFQGYYELPCGFVRRVYTTIGVGPLKDYKVQNGDNTEIISINQLKINSTNLAVFQNIVEGAEPKAYKGMEVGQEMKQ